MQKLGRGTAYNTHNITSLIRTPQACIRHLADGRSLHGGRVYTDTDTDTHTHTHTHTSSHTHTLDLLTTTLQCNIKFDAIFNTLHTPYKYQKTLKNYNLIYRKK